MKMHTKLLIRLTVCIIFLCANWVFSKEFSVSGKVIDVDKQPISFANVLLLRQIDSSFVAGTSTDDKGLFEFRNISKEQYLINISFIGYKTTSLTVDLIENITLD